MQMRKFRTGPIALTNVPTTNILNCAITALAGPIGFAIPQPYMVLKKITIVNKLGVAVGYSLFIGASAANAPGTEYVASNKLVQPFDRDEVWCDTRLDATDFLVGGASAVDALSIEIEGEIGISG